MSLRSNANIVDCLLCHLGLVQDKDTQPYYVVKRVPLGLCCHQVRLRGTLLKFKHSAVI